MRVDKRVVNFPRFVIFIVGGKCTKHSCKNFKRDTRGSVTRERGRERKRFYAEFDFDGMIFCCNSSRLQVTPLRLYKEIVNPGCNYYDVI